MSYFSKKRFTMRQVVGLLTVVFFGITVIAYAVTFTDFTTNTTISSSEMNTKLNALKDAINRDNTLVVGGEAFLPGSNVAYSNSYGMGGAYIITGSGALAAPVHLPQGAVSGYWI